MGLFGKKNTEKKKCPICGEELTFFGSKVVADGEICENCEKMIRGQFNIEEYWVRKFGASGYHREDYRLKTSDPLGEMTIEEIRMMINEKKQQQTKVLSEVGSKYQNVARVEDCFSIAPKMTEVGIKRAKELKNRIVTTSFIAAGEFSRGDDVILTTNGQDIHTKVLDVIICSDSSPFETELSANIGKHKAGANVNAWIILDVESGVIEGSLIQK